LQLLKKEGATILADHKLIKALDHKLIVNTNNQEKELAFDTLVLSLGVKPKLQEVSKFANLIDNVFLIGDCTSSQGTLYTATTGGFNAALDL
jgi:NADH dehydrogenase FAD-containing subunit